MKAQIYRDENLPEGAPHRKDPAVSREPEEAVICIRKRQDSLIQNSFPEILTISEVSAELRCSKAQIYKLINGEIAGCLRLPAISIGRKKVVRRSTLESWKATNERNLAGVIVSTDQDLNAVDA